MDKLEECAELLINEFIKLQHFQSIGAMLLYCESLKDMHKEENCQVCMSKSLNECHAENKRDSGIHCIEESSNSLTGDANASGRRRAPVVSSFRGNSFHENTHSIKLRKSRRSVCVPKLRYSTSASDSDETDDTSDNDNNIKNSSSAQSDVEVFIKEQHLRKLSDSSSRCRSEDHVDNNDEKCVSEKLWDLKICSSDEVATKERISYEELRDVCNNDDDDSDGPVVYKKKNVCKILSSSDESDDGNKIGSVAGRSSDSASTSDEVSENNSSISDMVHSILKDNVFASSSSDDDGDDFLPMCKETQNTRSSDGYSPDIKSIKKKYPLNTNVANIMTPQSSIRCIVNTFPTPKSALGTPAYKRHFNKMRDGIVKELFSLYNRTVFDNRLPHDFEIKWNKRLTKTAGFCYLKTYSNIRTSSIELSDKVIDSVERIRDTLIHELCHAATWIFEGKRGHGLAWKYWAKKANKKHTDLPVVTTCHNYEIQTKYKYQCDGCGTVFGRHSKSIDHSKQSCGNCGGKPLLISENISSSDTPHKLNPYASYVKEHFSRVKRNNPALSHKDLMKKIVEGYRTCKINENNKENVDSV